MLSLSLAVGLAVPALALFRWDDGVKNDLSLPTAENFSLVTERDVAISAELSGVDPEGEVLEFRITKRPARGAVTLAEEGSARFTYTPMKTRPGGTTLPTWRWTQRGTHLIRRWYQFVYKNRKLSKS